MYKEKDNYEHCGVGEGDCWDARNPNEKLSTPLADQIGGDHYSKLAIQPVDYIHANNLGFIEGCVVKYVSRHKSKNGKQDIEKAIHFLNILLELEYKN